MSVGACVAIYTFCMYRSYTSPRIGVTSNEQEEIV